MYLPLDVQAGSSPRATQSSVGVTGVYPSVT